MIMSDQEIIDEFVVEASELLANAEEDILDLESGGENEVVNRIFRAFHTIKGNAAMIGFESLTALAHKSEDTLSRVRSGHLTPDKSLIDLLLKVVDMLKQLMSDAKRGEESSADISGLTEELDRYLLDGAQPDAPQPAPAVTEPAAQIPVVEKKTGNLRILVAEDDYTSRKIMRVLLSHFGNVDAAVNGEEAVEAVKLSLERSPAQHYELICMDIMMPELDGMEAVKQIRTLEREKGIPLNQEAVIIMTTALSDPRTVIKSLYKSGATAYMIKPVDKERLEKELKKLALI